MGAFQHLITIFSPAGDQAEMVDAMVDTGSNYTWVPGSLLRRLGIEPDRERTFVLADSSRVRRQLGEARVSVDGEQVTTLVVFRPEGAVPLLGAYTLEGGLGLAADVTNQRLVPAENYAL